MKVCLLCEGSYPYTVGGVSSWVDLIITQMPETEFCIAAIVADREHAGDFKYKMPANLTSVSEVYLIDTDNVLKHGNRSKMRLSPAHREAFRSFVFGEDIKWRDIFSYFGSGVSVNELLMGPDVYDIITEYYNKSYDRLPYTDFLWTYRSMLLPLCLLLKHDLPEADIYHTVSAGYSGMLAAKAKILYDKPVIMTEHGIYTREREEDIIRSPEFSGRYKDLWIEHFYKLSNCAYEYCDKVISLFEGARTIQTELGCNPAKTSVVPNGVDEKRFETVAFKEDEGEINLGIIARVAPIKDIKTLITAFSVAQEKVKNLKLYIIGGPEKDHEEYFDECSELTATLKLDGVTFTGNVNIGEYMPRLDIVILTSISEGQPLSLLEAMSAGKPCIATKVGSCSELLLGVNPGDEVCGIVTPIMNVGSISKAITELALDKEKRRRYGEAGRRRVVEKYRKDQVIETYRDLYNYFHGIEIDKLADAYIAKMDARKNNSGKEA